MKGVVKMLNSPSLSPRQSLQGLSLECSTMIKKLIELALIDAPMITSDHYIEARKHLTAASLELSHLRAVSSPDVLALICRDLPDLDPIINRLT